MKYDVMNRFSGDIQFTAEIDCDAGAENSLKLGLAVKWAISNGADMSGAYLRSADLRGADMSGANLRSANLRGADLRGADMSGAYLRSADLRSANLRGADLRSADLRGADMSGADMSGADMSGADWIPKITNIHQSVYAAASREHALDMGSWHTCETTHCRAGWVIVLAGEGGKVLEGVYGPAAAAALIYQASDPTLERIPDFYTTNDEAMVDMKRLAEMEAAQ